MIFDFLKFKKNKNKDETPLKVEPVEDVWGDSPYVPKTREMILREINNTYLKNLDQFVIKKINTQDSKDKITGVSTFDNASLKAPFQINNQNIPDAILQWYGSQSFIGFQTCAMLYQNTLIAKACNLPAQDALRKGYKITVNDGSEIDLKILDEMRGFDTPYKVDHNLTQMESRCRTFGIRVCIFNIRGATNEFYENPFNPDGIPPGSYEGITQVDPSWITPELDMRSAGDPSYPYFLEPTWWCVNGRRYHRSHLIVIRHEEVPDIVKPAYFFSGLSIPQKIYQRVYNAVRSSNEAPMLLMTKRLMVKKVDMQSVLMNQQAFENRSKFASYFRDNYGTNLIDESEEISQYDTSLTDVDGVMMSQYRLIAAESGIPSTKFLGESPTGMNSSGNYEESSYHELLGVIKKEHYTPFLQRHYLLLLLSEICPKYGISPFDFTIEWEKSDEPTEKEAAEINKIKADADAVYTSIGALSGEDVRKKIINDPATGYNGLSDEIEVDQDFSELYETEEPENV